MGISREMLRQFRQITDRMSLRVANMVARAVVQRIDDSTGLQALQLGILDGEDGEDAERFQEYGFTSHPPAGCEAVVIFPNGDRAHPLVVAVGDAQNRVTGLGAGEVAIYNNAGSSVILRSNGDVEVTAAGEVKLGSDGAADPVIRKSDLDAHITVFNAHTHPYNPGPGSATPTLVPAPAPFPPGSTKVKSD